jgi:hypothetical protein
MYMQRYIQLRRLDDSVRKFPQEFLTIWFEAIPLRAIRIVSPDTSNPHAIAKPSEPN